MFRGLYTAATGMNFQLNRQDAIANNLANINTNGYKKDEAVGSSFRERLFVAIDRLGVTPIGTASLGVNLDDFYLDKSPGVFLTTENPLDLAISGNGYFLIESQNGEYLTRNGCFTRDNEGYLVTAEGNRVLGENGPILINGKDIVIGNDGSVTVDGNVTNRIIIVTPDNPDAILKEGENRIRFTGGISVAENSWVMQGTLEKSNVNPIKEMAKMIEVTRAYDSNQRVIGVMDQIMNRVANDIGRI